ncbi:hypothetical protein ACS0TY_008262 [Phlomoides rotata]
MDILDLFDFDSFLLILHHMELDPVINPSSPLTLHHNDNPAVAIVLDPLDGTNFVEWSIAVQCGLSVKNKLQLC